MSRPMANGTHAPRKEQAASVPSLASMKTAAEALADEMTTLQSRVASEIVVHIRRENLAVGDVLTESTLAEQIGTSRSPVRGALRHLERIGLLSHQPGKGFTLNESASELGEIAQAFSMAAVNPVYQRIAEARISRELPDVVNETQLMRMYDVSRSSLRQTLSRIQQEGWIEKAAGHGWTFQSMIDSTAAYEESYLFRAAIEPMGLTSGAFRVDRDELQQLRKQQLHIAQGGWETMTAIELFECNSLFHETIAKWSGNRFILQAVRRTDRLRRLVEYMQARTRSPRREQAQEHLRILDAIAVSDLLLAASLMREHLEGARRGKIYGATAMSDSKH